MDCRTAESATIPPPRDLAEQAFAIGTVGTRVSGFPIDDAINATGDFVYCVPGAYYPAQKTSLVGAAWRMLI